MLPFALAIISLVAAGFALWPVLNGSPAGALGGETDSVLGRLLQRKRTLFENLGDLELEHSMGKMPTQDYESMRDALELQAALVLEHIDLLQRTRASDNHDAAARFCILCGESLPARARFCSACGGKVA
ncbi:MAG TPA: zinc ribbon domain-containing protein [Candidatus Krumholzibacteria bacterium]|jgi:hypothetical protein